jgi:hypothetical protein
MPRTLIFLSTALLFDLLGCQGVAHAQSQPASNHVVSQRHVTDFGRPISVARLAAIRGGFDLGNGLEASFGIERAVYVNGNLVTYSSVNIPDIAHITTEQAISLASALNTVNVVQNGPGNTFDPLSLGQTSAATVIQNTLNNQSIRNITTLNVSVNTLNTFRDQGLQQALQAVQTQALGH